MRPRLGEVGREAARNLAGGTSRALLALIAFALAVGVCAVLIARGYVDVARQAAAWVAQGSATQIVPAPGHIDGAGCEALAQTAGITAAGAVRAADATRLEVLPAAPVQTFEVTPGMRAVLDVNATPGQQPDGVWLAEDLANVVGFDLTTLPVLVEYDDGGRRPESVAVAGVYPYPSDGRAAALAYSILAPVPAVGAFDACWVEIWPESDAITPLLMLPVLPQEGGQPPQIQQFNGTAGRTFDAAARLAAIPVWPLTFAALAVAAILGYLLIRARRLELASVLHAGIDKPSMLAQLQLETAAWTLTGAALIIPAVLFAARHGNPDPTWPAIFPALRLVTLAVIAAQLAALTAGILVREKHLFRHFKQR